MTTLLLADHDGTSILDATRKALTAARQLGAPVHVLVTGPTAAAEAAAKLDGVEKASALSVLSERPPTRRSNPTKRCGSAPRPTA